MNNKQDSNPKKFGEERIPLNVQNEFGEINYEEKNKQSEIESVIQQQQHQKLLQNQQQPLAAVHTQQYGFVEPTAPISPPPPYSSPYSPTTIPVQPNAPQFGYPLPNTNPNFQYAQVPSQYVPPYGEKPPENVQANGSDACTNCLACLLCCNVILECINLISLCSK